MTLQDHGGRRAFDLAAGMVGSSSPGPWFGFVNLMELHAPYDPPPRFHPLLASGATRGPGGPSMLHYQLRQMGFRKRPDRGYLETLRSLYWASARYQDRLLSRFLDMVRERDRPAVVLVVSDHGENLGDHGLFAHHSSLHETLLHVPFLTWGHRVEQFAGAVERPVSVAEASGWILSAVDRNGDGAGPVEGGLPLVSEYESTARHMGLPADLRKRLREGGPDALPRLVNSPGMAVRRDGLKYVATADGEERLFDLSSDPGEMHDVLPGGADQARSFRPLRDAWMKRRDGLRTGPSGERAEDEMAEHLRELGYIE
jgi:arylsulfatase A-like enzyme